MGYKKNNSSTGYYWTFRPDNSGVYKPEDVILLYPSTDAVGVDGYIIWKFKAIKEGSGSALFELHSPSSKVPVEIEEFKFEVSR